ncbi:hypothetical protein EAG_03319 [Camponotus floridanus]|uniref:Uncharacterized protein n=1 Tax=Camponotus floridanus TaxID=104421 RepID=E1ZWS0_CAMFO|nr:hypothetical protein EAG_03319 [Camponotus floridanus]
MGMGESNDASKGQQVAIRAYCFELLIANSCDRPARTRAASLLSFSVVARNIEKAVIVSSKFVASYSAPEEIRQEFYTSGRHVTTSDIRASPHGLHPPSYNTWSSSCALYPQEIFVPSLRLAKKFSSHLVNVIRREYRLSSSTKASRSVEGNPDDSNRIKAVTAVIIVDTGENKEENRVHVNAVDDVELHREDAVRQDADWASPSF